jgi:hypothetical protein
MVGLRANDRKAEEALLRRDGCVDGVSEVVVDATEAPDPMLQVTAIDRSTHVLNKWVLYHAECNIVCVVDVVALDRSIRRVVNFHKLLLFEILFYESNLEKNRITCFCLLPSPLHATL